MVRTEHLSISYWCCIPQWVAPEIVNYSSIWSVGQASLLKLYSLERRTWCASCTYSVISICSNRALIESIPRFTLSRFLVWLPVSRTVCFWISNSIIEGNVDMDLDASSKSSTCKQLWRIEGVREENQPKAWGHASHVKVNQAATRIYVSGERWSSQSSYNYTQEITLNSLIRKAIQRRTL